MVLPFYFLAFLALVRGDDPTTKTAKTATPTTMVLTSSSSSSSSSSTSKSSSSSPKISQIPKLYISAPSGEAAYELAARVGGINSGQDLSMRVDIVQPEAFVLNADYFYECSYLDNWFQTEESKYTSSYPSSVVDSPEFQATICAMGGRYTNSLAIGAGSATSISYTQPTATVAGIANGEPNRIAYYNGNNVSGVWETDELSFNVSADTAIELGNFTFLDVELSNLYYGGLGLAGNPKGSGFLNSLRNKGIIPSTGYSLWFQNRTLLEPGQGYLMPGFVDNSYFEEPLYSYKMIPHVGRSEGYTDVILPTLLLDDLSVENTQSGQSLSLKANDTAIPVILDSRSYVTYLPVDVIVNLAVQVNAFYSADVNQWLVECGKVRNASANMNFQFDDLEIEVPLSKFISEFTYDDTTVKFSDGSAACTFLFMPNTYVGYNALGLPFVSSIFLAVDNEGGNIAIANSNNTKTADAPQPPSSSLKAVSSDLTFSPNTTISGSIAYIESGTIPFATTQTKDPMTITIDELKTDQGFGDSGSVPARFSGYISNGVFVTRPYSTSTLPGGGVASAASANPSARSLGNKLYSPLQISVKDLRLEIMLVGFSLVAVLGGICAL